ncbi:hypothetical protein PC114_g14505 [Phytophthora cactorum]|uniref:Uncharacterized protein n=1 Tax=Phytophthora cactorum TaxID=29920 RepID=A0A8T1BYK7_9STRA|nr:hypothetical protein PC114_g14505 [Phytophthora cactorum]KAG2911144.1 hypothetical protein PC115_g12674 [Phytophthora cactorum]KAG2929390.1 hypothetical protein PC117_g14006 [Phytophthora cactorum]
MAVSRSYLWEQNPNIILPKKNLKPKLLLIAAQAILTFFYIGFGVVFTRCTSTQRFGLLIFLPVMKLFLKHHVAHLLDLHAVVRYMVNFYPDDPDEHHVYRIIYFRD